MMSRETEQNSVYMLRGAPEDAAALILFSSGVLQSTNNSICEKRQERASKREGERWGGSV